MPTGVEIRLSVDDEGWDADAVSRAEAAASRALGALVLPAGASEVSISLASDAAVQILNRDWRGIDKPTNVLAFPGDDAAAAGPTAGAPPLMLGDVVLARETVVREAAEQGKAVLDHLAHLVVHGVLHLGGYDHDTDADASDMEDLEVRILATLGIADPYAAERGAPDRVA